MAKCTLAQLHEVAVAPVTADREVWLVFLAIVEDQSLARLRKTWWRYALTDDSHEEMVPVDVEAGLMGPVALLAFPLSC